MTRIVVVGAGVVGLSTAVQIQQCVPGSKVTIVADKYFEETTSYGAGGIFRPIHSKNPDVPANTLKKWLRTSWDHLYKLAWSPEGGIAGVTTISGYHLWNSREVELPFTKEFTTDFRLLSEEELSRFPVKYKFGFFCTTLLCECRQYLPYLAKVFKSHGGQFKKRRLNSMTELSADYDVIVNCAGLGSLELLGDESLEPIRGHLIRVKAPWLKHYIYTENNCHLIPGQDEVIIGGTRQFGEFDTTYREGDHAGMWERAMHIYPPLKSADKGSAKVWVGLRPHRPSPRLELDHIDTGGKIIPVIHNYGHGAEGVSLSWGTATEAAELTKRAALLVGHQPLSRL